MAANATPSKVAATRGYGAEVVLHGSIWDEANEKARELVRTQGLTYVHPFDDEQLIAGQGTLGLEIVLLDAIALGIELSAELTAAIFLEAERAVAIELLATREATQLYLDAEESLRIEISAEKSS